MNENKTATELLPCPICGGQPEFQHFNITPNVRGRIICSCGLEIRQGANETEDDLRIIWNTRANEGTRWHELFGTPERAARTLAKACGECDDNLPCDECPLATIIDFNVYELDLFEWLRGDA